VTTYRFTNSLLNGFSVGGAWRWRSSAAIGYYGKQNPYLPDDATAFMPDLTRPISGPSESFLDAWLRYERDLKVAGKKVGWSCQLNVQNVADKSDIICVARNYDLTASPASYQKLDPRKIILSNTLSF
jgi:hypothetical protein